MQQPEQNDELRRWPGQPVQDHIARDKFGPQAGHCGELAASDSQQIGAIVDAAIGEALLLARRQKVSEAPVAAADIQHRHNWRVDGPQEAIPAGPGLLTSRIEFLRRKRVKVAIDRVETSPCPVVH